MSSLLLGKINVTAGDNSIQIDYGSGKQLVLRSHPIQQYYFSQYFINAVSRSKIKYQLGIHNIFYYELTTLDRLLIYLLCLLFNVFN